MAGNKMVKKCITPAPKGRLNTNGRNIQKPSECVFTFWRFSLLGGVLYGKFIFG